MALFATRRGRDVRRGLSRRSRQRLRNAGIGGERPPRLAFRRARLDAIDYDHVSGATVVFRVPDEIPLSLDVMPACDCRLGTLEDEFTVIRRHYQESRDDVREVSLFLVDQFDALAPPAPKP